MTHRPLLSFVIPVYNAAQYLHRCIDSIITQHTNEVEIILINDGSTDTSGAICDEYARQHPFMHVHHQQNTGVAAARNIGMKNALGTYVHFLDNDDWLEPNTLTRHLAVLHSTQADIVMHRYNLTGKTTSIGNDTLNATRINNHSADAVLSYLRTSRINITAPWEYTFKKTLATNNNIEFSALQNGVDDTVFTPTLFCVADSFWYDSTIILNWHMRIDSQGRTHNISTYITKMFSVIDSLEKLSRGVVGTEKECYLFYRIYKECYALIGTSMSAVPTDQNRVRIWVQEHASLICETAKHSGILHSFIVSLCGPYKGPYISLQLAKCKGIVERALKTPLK